MIMIHMMKMKRRDICFQIKIQNQKDQLVIDENQVQGTNNSNDSIFFSIYYVNMLQYQMFNNIK